MEEIMGLILFITVIAVGCAMAFRMLGLDITIQLPSNKAKLLPDALTSPTPSVTAVSEIAQKAQSIDLTTDAKDEQLQQIEQLRKQITHKEKQVQSLAKQVELYQKYLQEAEKVKKLLDGEIVRLREQNRILRQYQEGIHA